MTTFDHREKAFETKFAHDEELAFKIIARRNKLLGLWAAEKLGKSGEDAQQYALDVLMADFESEKHDIADILLKDMAKAGLPVSAKEVNLEMERLLLAARQQIMGV